jgi:hypothetical protein
MPLFGLVHDVEHAARRLVDGLHDPALKSGALYASEAKKVTGPMVDQSAIFPDLPNVTFQDHASEAVHRVIVWWNADPLTACSEPRCSR